MKHMDIYVYIYVYIYGYIYMYVFMYGKNDKNNHYQGMHR